MKDIFRAHKAFLVKLFVFLLSLTLAAALGFFQHSANPYFAFYLFYLVPIFLATWFINEWAGLAILFGCLVIWVSDGFRSIDVFGYSIFSAKLLNQVLKFAFYCLLIYLICFIKDLLKKLRKADALKTQFVANVSHELRSPLFIIKESISVILDGLKGEVRPEQREVLEMARGSVDRLLRLVGNLLDISKIEAGKVDLRVEKIDIAPFLNGVIKDFELVFSKKSITFSAAIPSSVGSFWGDRDKICEVLVNLLSNAVKYTPEKGSVGLSVQGGKKEVLFKITDSGPGIPEGQREKIFDKFERITSEKQEGTGLGLPIARDIVRLHKGRIWVGGERGKKGSQFIFVLPRDFSGAAKVPPSGVAPGA